MVLDLSRCKRLLPKFLCLSFGLLCLLPPARAQLGVYGTVTVEHVTGIQCLQVICGSNDGTISPLGGTAGVFYDFRQIGPVRLGADVRVSSTLGNKNAATYFNTAKPRIFSALGGIRASFRTPFVQLRPYVQGSVGLARSNINLPQDSTGRVQYHSGLQYRGFAGADLAVLPVMDFRVVELGIGGIRNNGGSNFVDSISTGLVFHLPF